MDLLTDPFAYAFFPRVLVAAVLAGAVCGAIGAFVVVRRMSYIAHGLSHAVIGGAAVSGVLGFNLLLGAGVWAFVSALLIERVSRIRGLYADTAIGVVTTASFALGIAVISAASRWERNLESFLFGGLLGVDTTDVVIAFTVVVVVAVVFTLWFRPLQFVTFDRDVALAQGLPVVRYETVLSLLLTATVVASMRILGVLLVAAAIVIPAATARLATDRFERMVPLAALIGAGTAVPALYASWYLDVASGAAIVLTQTLVMAVVGVVAAARRRQRVAYA